MPKVKDTTLTDKKMAGFYGLTPQTLYNYKSSDNVKLNNRYKALRKFYKRWLRSIYQLKDI